MMISDRDKAANLQLLTKVLISEMMQQATACNHYCVYLGSDTKFYTGTSLKEFQTC